MIECSFEGCSKPKLCKGLCNGHYHQQLRGSELKPLLVGVYTSEHKTCSVDECEAVVRARRLCAKHLYRMNTYGDPLVIKRHFNHAPRSRSWDNPSYVTVHHRIKKKRGLARHQPCWLCHEPAHHWAYDHKDLNQPDQLEENGLLYSRDIERYRPMCRTCHQGFDARKRAARATASA